MLEISEANARQLATRARAHLDRERTAEVPPAEQQRLLAAFIAAAQHGDLEALEAVLAEDVVALSDGGGVVLAARKPVIGRERVAQFLLGVLEKFAADIETVPIELNGGVGFVGHPRRRADGRVDRRVRSRRRHTLVQRAEPGEAVTSDGAVRS